jgi:hypothetical protein
MLGAGVVKLCHSIRFVARVCDRGLPAVVHSAVGYHC